MWGVSRIVCRPDNVTVAHFGGKGIHNSHRGVKSGVEINEFILSQLDPLALVSKKIRDPGALMSLESRCEMNDSVD